MNHTFWQISDGKMYKIYFVKKEAESVLIGQDVPKYSQGTTEVISEIMLLKDYVQKKFKLLETLKNV